MSDQSLRFTKHAELMLAERHIRRDWINRAISVPDAIERDPNRENVFRAFRSIPERNGRILRVVYSQDGDDLRVITAFFDRARRS